MNAGICAYCSAEVSEFFSEIEITFRDSVGHVVVGICEACYHKAHRSRRALGQANRYINKQVHGNPELYRVGAP
jgi:hypothetical protein